MTGFPWRPFSLVISKGGCSGGSSPEVVRKSAIRSARQMNEIFKRHKGREKTKLRSKNVKAEIKLKGGRVAALEQFLINSKDDVHGLSHYLQPETSAHLWKLEYMGPELEFAKHRAAVIKSLQESLVIKE